MTALGVAGLVGIVALVPPQPASAGLRGELAVFRRRGVWPALVTTALGFGAVFASFTYVAPMMTEVAGFSPGAVTWLLVLFGAGLCVGNVVGGRAADRRLMPSLYAFLGALVLVPAAVTIAVFGVFGFATVAPLQARVLEQASGAPALASAANIAAFNLDNAAGAWLGGVAIDAGFGYTAPNWVGAATAPAALGVAVASGVSDRARRSRPAVAV